MDYASAFNKGGGPIVGATKNLCIRFVLLVCTRIRFIGRTQFHIDEDQYVRVNTNLGVYDTEASAASGQEVHMVSEQTPSI